MKAIITALFAMAAMTVMAQTKVSLSGKASEGAKTVYIYNDLAFRGTPDSVAVTDGAWHYEAVKPARQYVMGVCDDKTSTRQLSEKLVFILVDAVATDIDLPTGSVKGSKGSVAMNETMHGLLQLMQQEKNQENEQKALALMRNAVMGNLDSMLPAVFVPMIADGLSVGDLQKILQPVQGDLQSVQGDLQSVQGDLQSPLPFRTFANVDEVKAELQSNCPEGRLILIKGSNSTRLHQLPPLL